LRLSGLYQKKKNNNGEEREIKKTSNKTTQRGPIEKENGTEKRLGKENFLGKRRGYGKMPRWLGKKKTKKMVSPASRKRTGTKT